MIISRPLGKISTPSAAPGLGLEFAFRSYDLSQADGSLVPLWVGRGPGVRRLTTDLVSGAPNPTFQNGALDLINGNPVVRVAAGEGLAFNFGGGDWTPIKTSSDWTFYWAGRYTSPQAGAAILLQQYAQPPDQSTIILAMDFGSDLAVQTTDNDGNNPRITSAAALAGSNLQVITFVTSSVGTGDARIYRNKVQLAETSSLYWDFPRTFGEDSIQAFNGPGGSFVSDTVEFRGYSKAHSQSQINRVAGQLMATLGI